VIENLEEKINDTEFVEDAIALKRNEEKWDFREAYRN